MKKQHIGKLYKKSINLQNIFIKMVVEFMKDCDLNMDAALWAYSTAYEIIISAQI